MLRALVLTSPPGELRRAGAVTLPWPVGAVVSSLNYSPKRPKKRMKSHRNGGQKKMVFFPGIHWFAKLFWLS
jgi:hypothetical protein